MGTRRERWETKGERTGNERERQGTISLRNFSTASIVLFVITSFLIRDFFNNLIKFNDISKFIKS